MRLRNLLPLLLCALLAGCAATDDLKETGISRADAVRIAEQHCSQYPDEYSYVDHAEWDPDGHFWAVALTDRDGDHGKAFKIDRDGSIIDTHKIDLDEGDESGPRHYGYGWGYWW
jgi:hypothetical protein